MAKKKAEVKVEKVEPEIAPVYKMEEVIPEITADEIPGIALRDKLNKIIEKINKI